MRHLLLGLFLFASACTVSYSGYEGPEEPATEVSPTMSADAGSD